MRKYSVIALILGTLYTSFASADAVAHVRPPEETTEHTSPLSQWFLALPHHRQIQTFHSVTT
ncbi:MAG: hypothetical protein LBF34_04075 [Puniceicoccales bacterium]|nr:hypothetical protein [Puniceicoccales bacterium]